MTGLLNTCCVLLFLCCMACARSGVPEQVASESGAAGGPAASPPPAGASSEPPARPSSPAESPAGRGQPGTSLVDACGRCPLDLPAELTRQCLCEAASCPRDFADALAQVERWDAYGEGCKNVWLVERTERRGFSSFTFDRASGVLTLIGRYAGDPLPGCALNQEQLIMSDGMAAECAHETWCTFPGITQPIGIGELDEAPTCDIGELARAGRRSGRR